MTKLLWRISTIPVFFITLVLFIPWWILTGKDVTKVVNAFYEEKLK